MISRQFAIDVQLRGGDVPSFDSYPFSLAAVRHLDVLKLHPKVTYIVGENGSGKSTLLEANAVSSGFNAEGGSKNFRFGTRSSHSPLHEYLRIAKGVRRPKDGFFLRAESFFNVATEIERLDSEGGGNGLYLLDEPEAALSPQRQLAALARIHDLVKAGSQFIIATHSPILMAYPDAYIYACSAEGIALIDYYETEHYRVMHDFVRNPKRMLDVLFAE
jgi:predicted ATPase